MVNKLKLNNKITCAIGLFKAKLLKRRFPFAVSWHLTYRCNYNCLYCDIRSKADENNELSTLEVFSVIDDLGKMGTRRIHFCGGESLLREDFPAIIDYCRDRSIETGLISNGALIPHYVRYLKNLTLLKLSLDGPPVVQDKLRGAGSYERIMMAVGAARLERIATVFNCTLSNLNLPYVEFMLEKSTELKIPIKFSALNYVHSGEKDIKDLIPEPALYKEKLDYIKVAAKKNRYILNSESNLRYISFYPQGHKINHCIAGRIFCHIKPDGSVYPCGRVGSRPAPNCKKEGIKKAFYALPLSSCNECWCTSTLELNLIYSLDIAALINALRRDL